MKAAAYRRLRIAIGTIVLAFCALAFADIGNWVSATTARAALWPQFAPSLLGMLQGAAWISAGCIAVIALTLVFGRVYCAMLCPLGVLMDLSAWLAGRTGKKRKLPYHPGRPWLRALAVVLCAVGLLAGTAVPLALLDPFSVFGKITAATLRPAFGWINHLLASAKMIHPVDVSPVAWTSAGVALGLLLLVVVSAVFRGRLWCNTGCPVGAVLGFFSKHAWFRLRIADTACVGCSMCERVCPAQCIDFRKRVIDHSRCVMCLDCVTSCKRSGITLAHGGDHRNKEAAQEPLHASCKRPASVMTGTRRRFIASAAIIPAAALAADSRPPGTAKLTQHNKRPVLPPGAKSLAHFQSRCTACHLCVANCPDQVLRPSITQHGLSGFLQPYQDFSVAFCSYNCSNCSQICPTGAIRPITVDERRTVRTGTAELFLDRCVVKTKGTSCGACNEHCPTQAVHMVPWKNGLTIPEVDPALCIGCGGCEFICPVRPDKAIVVNGLPVHERAKTIVLGQKNTVREIEEEFPF
jgi:formate hydrogenlyase subunit 6/NADH:ubiquinone oxidoreductase subunit I